ncbi:hypothetical protein MJD09_25585 [bacterium]|nr:hypothetical protein [bacterium]
MEDAFANWGIGRTLKTVSIYLVIASSACAFAALSALASLWEVPILRASLGTMINRFGAAALVGAVTLVAAEILKHLAGRNRYLDFGLPVVPVLLIIVGVLMFLNALQAMVPMVPCFEVSVPEGCLAK